MKLARVYWCYTLIGCLLLQGIPIAAFGETNPEADYCPVESFNQSPLAKMLGGCCPGKQQGLVQAEPLDLLNSVSSKDAGLVQELSNIFTGQALPIFTDDELDLLVDSGLATRWRYPILRSISQVTNKKENRTYDDKAKQNCRSGGEGEDFPQEGYAKSMMGAPAKVYPYDPNVGAPKSGPFYDWCLMYRTRKMWVSEPVWLLFPDSKNPMVVGSLPGEGPTGSWIRGELGRLPTNLYSLDAFIESLNAGTRTAHLESDAFTTDFMIGLIPVVGGGIQFVDGIQTGDRANIALGAVGLFGDLAFVGLVADACKLPKLGKAIRNSACAASFIGNGASVVLIARNFLNEKGNAFQAGMGTLATAQILATIVLMRKYKRVGGKQVDGAPTEKALDVGSFDCPTLKPKVDCNTTGCAKTFEGNFEFDVDADSSKTTLGVTALKDGKLIGKFQGNTVYPDEKLINFGTVKIENVDCRYGLNGTQLYQQILGHSTVSNSPGKWKLSSYFTWDNRDKFRTKYNELIEQGVAPADAIKQAVQATPTYIILVEKLGGQVTKYPPSVDQLTVEWSINIPLK